MNQWVANAIEASGQTRPTTFGEDAKSFLQGLVNVAKASTMTPSLIPSDIQSRISTKLQAGTPLSGYEQNLLDADKHRINQNLDALLLQTDPLLKNFSSGDPIKSVAEYQAMALLASDYASKHWQQKESVSFDNPSAATNPLQNALANQLAQRVTPDVRAELFRRGIWSTKSHNVLNRIGSTITAVVQPVGKVATTLVGSPFTLTADIVGGKRLDKALLKNFKDNLKAAKDIAPYVQTVVSFVPGIGQGVAGMIGAAGALAAGKSISESLVAGVKGALPGGPITAAAMDITIAAAQGKPIDEIAIAALPIDDSQKDLIKRAAHVVKAVAKGEKVEAIVYEQAIEQLPAKIQDGIAVGATLGIGKALQDKDKNDIPNTISQLKQKGKQIIEADKVLKAGNDRLKHFEQKDGNAIGHGAVSFTMTPHQFKVLRGRLAPQQKLGFDIAVSTHIGKLSGSPRLKDHNQSFDLYTLTGMAGAKKSNKVAMTKAIGRSLGANAEYINYYLPQVKPDLIDKIISFFKGAFK